MHGQSDHFKRVKPCHVDDSTEKGQTTLKHLAKRDGVYLALRPIVSGLSIAKLPVSLILGGF